MKISKAYLLGFSLLMLWVQSALSTATPSTPLQKGVFLIAARNLAYSKFRETVILITRYAPTEGAMGLTVNRDTGVKLNKLFPKLKRLSHNSGELFAGGPVQPGTLLLLAQSARATHGMEHVFSNIHFATGVLSLTQILTAKTEHDRLRAYSGYAGWSPNQLENEIKRGDWLVVPADSDLIFAAKPRTLWRKLTKTWSGTWM